MGSEVLVDEIGVGFFPSQNRSQTRRTSSLDQLDASNDNVKKVLEGWGRIEGIGGIEKAFRKEERKTKAKRNKREPNAQKMSIIPDLPIVLAITQRIWGVLLDVDCVPAQAVVVLRWSDLMNCQ
jgi:hypothetical protein